MSMQSVWHASTLVDLRRAVSRARRARGAPVDIISHSMGGLVVKAYACVTTHACLCVNAALLDCDG
jgi:alpha-beta hydrolase superfamily lysophospholipase